MYEIRGLSLCTVDKEHILFVLLRRLHTLTYKTVSFPIKPGMTKNDVTSILSINLKIPIGCISASFNINFDILGQVE